VISKLGYWKRGTAGSTILLVILRRIYTGLGRPARVGGMKVRKASPKKTKLWGRKNQQHKGERATREKIRLTGWRIRV